MMSSEKLKNMKTEWDEIPHQAIKMFLLKNNRFGMNLSKEHLNDSIKKYLNVIIFTYLSKKK